MQGDNTKNPDPQFISFHDFSSINQAGNVGQAQLDIGASTRQTFNNLPNDSTGIGILEDLQDLPDRDEGTPQHNFWTIEYYQKYFNVNTNDVLERIKRSIFIKVKENYLLTHIRPNPDLYGPFWICVTLIFFVAIGENMSNYLQTANSSHYHWTYNFHVVSYAATTIFLYAWLLPLILWAAMRWTSSTSNMEEELIESRASPGLLELICLYGYSLAVYIPVTFLCMVQITWFQWTVISIATFLSAATLLRSLYSVIGGKHRIIYAVIILGLHILLALSLILYFFHAIPKAAPKLPPVTEKHIVSSTLSTQSTAKIVTKIHQETTHQ